MVMKIIKGFVNEVSSQVFSVLFMLVLVFILPSLVLSNITNAKPVTKNGKEGEILSLIPNLAISVVFYLFVYFLLRGRF